MPRESLQLHETVMNGPAVLLLWPCPVHPGSSAAWIPLQCRSSPLQHREHTHNHLLRRNRRSAIMNPVGGLGLSPQTRMMCGFTLILVPGIVYGGLTVLGVVTGGRLGAPGPRDLSPAQVSLYRAGHAHAGVLMLLSLFIQLAMDYASLPQALIWPERLGAIAAAMLVAGGFFAIAHLPGLRFLLYAGATLVIATTLVAGIGLLRG